MSALTYRGGCKPELYTVPSGSYGSNISFGAGAQPVVSFKGIEYPDETQFSYNTLTYAGFPVYTATLNTNTCVSYRKKDDIVIFEISVDINTNSIPTVYPPMPTIPGLAATGSELRIRGLPLASTLGNEPVPNFVATGTFSRFLPPAAQTCMQPIFREVQLYNLLIFNTTKRTYWNAMCFDTGVPGGASSTVPSGAAYDIQARLLSDDTIALYINVFDSYEQQSNVHIPITYEMFTFATQNPILTPGSNVGLSRITIKGEYISA